MPNANYIFYIARSLAKLFSMGQIRNAKKSIEKHIRILKKKLRPLERRYLEEQTAMLAFEICDIKKAIQQAEVSLVHAPKANLMDPVYSEKTLAPKPKLKRTGLKIAVDVAVGNEACKYLESHGMQVLVVAKHGETDESWVERAIREDIDVVVSDDRQVQFDAKQFGMVSVPSAGKDPKGHRLYRMIRVAVDEA